MNQAQMPVGKDVCHTWLACSKLCSLFDCLDLVAVVKDLKPLHSRLQVTATAMFSNVQHVMDANGYLKSK